MAMAAKQKGEDRHAVAIIGDGALTAGMAFEALNNAGVVRLQAAGHPQRQRHVDQPAGGRAQPLPGAAHERQVLRRRQERRQERAARRAAAVRTGQALRAACQGHGGAGHAVREVRLQLHRPDRRPRPRFADSHAGEPQAASTARSSCTWSPRRARATSWPRPTRWPTTAPASSIRRSAWSSRATAPKQTFTQVFGQWLCDMAAQDGRLVGITPAMREGSGMVEFEQRFPERYYDVGIAEQHAVTFAAGLACEGLKPVVAIYSTFLQRAYDQLIHDVAIQNLPVVFALDRAGLVGADGATHAGAYDIPFLRCIPNMSIACPADEAECRQLLTQRLRAGPPGGGALPARRRRRRHAAASARRRCPSARARSARARAQRIAILAFGTLLYPALQAAEALDATVVNMRWAKPLDVELLLQGGRRRTTPRHAGRGRHHGRRGQRGARGPAGRAACCKPGAATGPARRVHRAWRSGASCWPCRASMPRASRSRCASDSSDFENPQPAARAQAGISTTVPPRPPKIHRPAVCLPHCTGQQGGAAPAWRHNPGRRSSPERCGSSRAANSTSWCMLVASCCRPTGCSIPCASAARHCQNQGAAIFVARARRCVSRLHGGVCPERKPQSGVEKNLRRHAQISARPDILVPLCRGALRQLHVGAAGLKHHRTPPKRSMLAEP